MNNKKNIIYLITIIFLCYLVFFVIFWKILFGYKLDEINYSTEVFDRNNIFIWEIKKNYIYHKNEQNYPSFLKKAIIQIEDRRFYYHNWIDILWILRATKNNILWNSRQWASTIHAQIIRNTKKNNTRNILNKINEFKKWYWLHYYYNKEEILNLYLNNIAFEKNIIWFSSAWEYYFWKPINLLTINEQIALITIINNPNFYSPYKKFENFKNRYELIKNKLIKEKIIKAKDIKYINIENLNFKNSLWKNFDDNSNYLLDYIKSDETKYYSTIDINLTNDIENLANESIKSLKWKNVWDYWVIIIDTKSMELLTMIWWINYNSKNWQVNSTTALRQAWSTLKPFLYLKYFKEFNKNWDDKIVDAPIWFETEDGTLYSPKNYSLDYKYEISLKESLSQSLNIPAVKILNELWISNFIKFLKEVWIKSIKNDPNFYGLSIALWSWEVNLVDLTKAYAIFFNNWKYCELIIQKWQKKYCNQVIEDKYISKINEILKNRYYKLEWFWINSELDFQNIDVFFKTWTSRNFKDNWIIWGFDNYLIWVWAWNKDWTEMKWVSWATWAWNIFKKIINYLSKWKNEDQIIPKFSDKKVEYLEIIKPLNFTTFKKENFLQKTYLDFKTNIEYDEHKWFLNDKEVKNNELIINELNENNYLKLIIYKNNNIVKSTEIIIRLKN